MSSFWARQTEERTEKVYRGIIDILFESRDTDLVIKELLVRAEILKRDFTKRQLNIVLLIITFSYPYNKEWALLPNMQDFQLCGVNKSHIKMELEKLVELSVIKWNREERLYRLEKPSKWKVPYQKGYADARSMELFLLNLKHAGVDTTELMRRLEMM